MRALATALVLVIPSVAAAQVTVQARARTELWVSAAVSPSPPNVQRVPQGTDVTAGYSITARATGGVSGTATSSASSDLTIAHGTRASVVDLREGAAGGFDLLGAQASAGFGAHEVEIVYRSPVAIPATLRIELCGGASSTIGRYSGRALVGGVTRLVATPGTSPLRCVFGQYPQHVVVPVVVDRTGVQIVLATSGWATGALRGGNGSSVGRWRLTLTPDPSFPCSVTSYGPSCGATLTSAGDLRYPGMHRLTLDDPSRPPFAWIAAGVQRASTPFLGCTLLTDNRIIGPWPIDPNGAASVLFAPPSTPGLVFTAQGLTLGTALHASNGLELRCR